MFHGIFGNYVSTENRIELLEGEQPYNAKNFLFQKYSKKL